MSEVYVAVCYTPHCGWSQESTNPDQAIRWLQEHEFSLDHQGDVIEDRGQTPKLMGSSDYYHWTEDAACVGDDRFIDPQPSQTRELASICHSCPVFKECSEWARGQTGVFAAGKWLHEESLEDWHGKATGGLQ